jgi:3-phosphoglycerate kinase
VLGHLAKKVDFLIIGGGMVNTFLFAKGSARPSLSLASFETVQRAQRRKANEGEGRRYGRTAAGLDH